jgi:hypothetical protein
MDCVFLPQNKPKAPIVILKTSSMSSYEIIEGNSKRLVHAIKASASVGHGNQDNATGSYCAMAERESGAGHLFCSEREGGYVESSLTKRLLLSSRRTQYATCRSRSSRKGGERQ